MRIQVHCHRPAAISAGIEPWGDTTLEIPVSDLPKDVLGIASNYEYHRRLEVVEATKKDVIKHLKRVAVNHIHSVGDNDSCFAIG